MNRNFRAHPGMSGEVVDSVLVREVASRLPEIMEKHGIPEHPVRADCLHRMDDMLADTVDVVRVVARRHHACIEFRENNRRDAGLVHRHEFARVRRYKKFRELRADALGAHFSQIRGHLCNGGQRRRLNRIVELCTEANRPHDAQRIFRETAHRVADGPDEPALYIVHAPEEIHQASLRVICHGIDREIAPLEILFEACREGDVLRMPPVLVLSVNPVSCDFKSLAAEHNCDRTVPDAGIDRSAEQSLDLLRFCRCRDVPVLRFSAEDGVADTSSDNVRLKTGVLKGIQYLFYFIREFYRNCQCRLSHSQALPASRTTARV